MESTSFVQKFNAELIPSVRFAKIFFPPATATNKSLYESLSNVSIAHDFNTPIPNTYVVILKPSDIGSGLEPNSSTTITPNDDSVIGAALGLHPSL